MKGGEKGYKALNQKVIKGYEDRRDPSLAQ